MHPVIIIGTVRSLIVDVAMRQIPRSTERISSLDINTRSSATAKNTARPSCFVGVLYEISLEKICWWLINPFYVIGHESYRIGRNNAKQWPLRRSGSFKVTDFGTNRKPICECDFLLLINTNLPLILHRFQVMADYMSNFP